MTKTATAGQAVTTEIRAMHQIGPRSRRNRKVGRQLAHDAVVRNLREITGEFRGIESDRRTAILDKAHTALAAYGKFVQNYRIDGVLRFQIMDMSPWQFSAFLGDMVDSGCTNMGEFEAWFADRTRALHSDRIAA